MVDVSMRQDDCVNGLGIEWKLLVFLKRDLAFSLIHAAVKQESLAGNMNQVHGTGDSLSRAPKLNFHGYFVSAASIRMNFG